MKVFDSTEDLRFIPTPDEEFGFYKTAFHRLRATIAKHYPLVERLEATFPVPSDWEEPENPPEGKSLSMSYLQVIYENYGASPGMEVSLREYAPSCFYVPTHLIPRTVLAGMERLIREENARAEKLTEQFTLFGEDE